MFFFTIFVVTSQTGMATFHSDGHTTRKVCYGEDVFCSFMMHAGKILALQINEMVKAAMKESARCG